MLKQRVITALILLAILLPALFYTASTVPFAALMLLFMAAGAWEWGRLNGFGQAGSLGLGLSVRRCAPAPGGPAGWISLCPRCG
jgi:phosphatidate cytidylyltransferase